MASDVPPELIGLILCNLHGDKTSLSACSLVSLRWLAEARHYLFNSVSFTLGRDDGRLRAVVPESLKTTFREHTTHLTITGEVPDAESPPTGLISLLSHFSLVRSLKLHVRTDDPPTKAFWQPVFGSLRGLTKLQLEDTSFAQTADLIICVSELQSLTHLSLNNVELDDYSASANDIIVPPETMFPQHLLYLSLVGGECLYDSFLEWLCQCDGLPRVQQLYVDELTRNELLILERLLHRLAPSLEDVAVQSSRDNEFALNALSGMDFSSNIALQRLLICYRLSSTGEHRKDRTRLPLDLVSRLPKTLEELSVGILQTGTEVDEYLVDSLASQLADTKLVDLKSCTLWTGNGDRYSRSITIDRLSDLHELRTVSVGSASQWRRFRNSWF